MFSLVEPDDNTPLSNAVLNNQIGLIWAC